MGLALAVLAIAVPAVPAAADCVVTGEGWEEKRVCAVRDGTCLEVWASSGPRQFPIWDTCP